MTGSLAGSVDVVVVAAGSSSRMGGVDKLMAPILGRPLLAWTLSALRAARTTRSLIVVSAPDRLESLAAAPWLGALDATVVAGGARRQDSVARGVAAAASELVLVHDGARPLVTPGLVDRVAAATAVHGAALPGRPMAETLKRVSDAQVVETIDRRDIVAAQTPQGCRRSELLAAFAALDATDPEATDESALLEAAGITVAVIHGDADNLKVTTREDLALAEALMAGRLGRPRLGQGHDSHPFGPGDGLALGGIRIADAPALHGHSDGDAALHAIADALLAATGAGDLGRRFPDGDIATRGIDSGRLLAAVVDEAGANGWWVTRVDLHIRGSRPRFGAARLEAMREAIAGLTGVTAEAVAVHASSGNLDGPEGAGRSIAASAIVEVVRR